MSEEKSMSKEQMRDIEPAWCIVRADYANSAHASAVLRLLDEYASSPSGGAEPLSDATRAALIPALQRSPAALTLLAFAAGTPVGLLNAFETLSTFKAKPLLNIHDLVVTAGWRRRGLGAALMRAVERVGRERGCCKLTLEVLEYNLGAQALYREMGYAAYQLQETFGRALFWQKEL